MKSGKKQKAQNIFQNHTWIGMRLVVGLAIFAVALAGTGSVQARPLSVFVDCASQGFIPETECLALVAVYDNTGGASWTSSTGWKSLDNPCDWWGVYCTDGHVAIISLGNNNLAGTISTQLGNLSYLTDLYLNSNSLTGGIPIELSNLSNLVNLVFYGNSLSGSIPVELSNLSSISTLNLSSNNLTGSIPSELGDLPNLIRLNLSNNDLTGSIPLKLGNLSNLQELILHNNNLSGSIPSKLGNLSSLQYLYLNGNNFTGSIPASLGNLSNLRELFLYSNSLSGFVPKELGNLTNLLGLRIEYNTYLSGWLPSSLTNLTALNKFYFNNTSLCERPDTAFQDWLTNIDSTGTLISTGVTCNILLSDGFESGNFSAWDAAQVGGGDLVVCAKAAINGAKGMCVKNLTNNTKFVTDSGLSADVHSAQFNLDPNGLNLQNLKIVRVFLAKSGATPAYWLQMRKISGKFQLRVTAKLDGGTNVTTAWKRISNNPHLIEIEWEAAIGPGYDDGYLNLYIDGRLWRKKLNLDNDTFVVDTIRMGFTNSPKKFTVSGIFFIDDYLSSDSGYIGQ